MSTATTSIVPCPSLQASLNDYFVSCHLNARPLPLVEFLLSSENTSGIRQLVNPSVGKKRTVQLVYDQQVPVSAVTTVDSCDLNCTAETQRGNLSEDYTIECTDGVEAEELITLTDWMESCRDNGELINSRTMALMNAVAKKVNLKTAGELNAVIGDWDTSVAEIGTIDANGFLNLPTSVSGNPAPYTFQDIQLAKEYTEFCNATFMVGGGDWYRYMRLIQSGCCADYGVDLGDLFARFGHAVAFDKDVNATFGNDTAVILQLGSAQLLTLNYAMNMDAPSLAAINFAAASNYFSAQVIHPATGIPMDLIVSNSCGNISIIVRATTKLVALPNDLYPGGDAMEGVNWITGVKSV